MINLYTTAVSLFESSSVQLRSKEDLEGSMCNRTTCAQVHELAQSHCGDDRKSTLFS